MPTPNTPKPPPEEWIAAERAKCADDICHWVNTYVSTYDPRLDNPILPFALFAKQAEFLLWLDCREHNREDGLAEKCRDVGFTWLCCAFACHRFLFRPMYAVGFGSRKERLVDELGNLDSIMEKCRFVIEHLPGWMQPKGYKRGVNDGFLKITNPETGATITGEGGDNIGRGGRKSIYFIDEHAFLARAKKVEAALSATSNCKIRVSTPNGTGNPFHTLRFGGKIPVFTFRWRDDPRKTDAWYQKQVETLDAVTVAQEIDIDYTASIEGICIPAKWVQAAVELVASAKFRELYPHYRAAGPILAGLDVAGGGKNRNVWIARRGIEILAIETWQHLGPSGTAGKATDLTHGLHGTQLSFDAVGVGEGVLEYFNTREKAPDFLWLAVYGGNPATETVWPDGKTSRERYLNLRAEMWMLMRSRFEKTYEVMALGKQHPADELISIPANEYLISQVSTPLMLRTNTDKTKIESKDDMRKRSIDSPDFADALAYTFAPSIGDFGDTLLEDAPGRPESPFETRQTSSRDEVDESESASVLW